MILWVKTPPEAPWTQWWQELCTAHKWKTEWPVERWHAGETPWPQIVDASKTFSLFAKEKVLLISHVDKAFKGQKEAASMLAAISKSPFRIVLVSDQEPPKAVNCKVWSPTPSEADRQRDEKSSFRWIDLIHQGRLTEALKLLEASLDQDQHPLALVQLVSRDFRLGRLIQHALEQRLREEEIIQSLRINPYAIKKWRARSHYKKSQWSEIFNRLQRADLELKSNSDEAWVLRKLTFDLVEIVTDIDRPKRTTNRSQTSSMPRLQLWPSATSFA
jgi:DNA polymerase III delta subunit